MSVQSPVQRSKNTDSADFLCITLNIAFLMNLPWHVIVFCQFCVRLPF